MNKKEILQSALSQRNDEIFNYQINIDNYQRAIEKIQTEYKDNQKLDSFLNNLNDLLESSKLEQLKSIIIRDVIRDQLNELE